MACIVYCEDKVLVTTEEFPPVVEVDDDYMGQAKSHFHWLLKVSSIGRFGWSAKEVVAKTQSVTDTFKYNKLKDMRK